MFNIPYSLYMMESEGMDDMVTTKTARINASIKDFVSLAKRGSDINEIQEAVFDRHNLSLDDLSAKDKARIKREVERRFR